MRRDEKGTWDAKGQGGASSPTMLEGAHHGGTGGIQDPALLVEHHHIRVQAPHGGARVDAEGAPVHNPLEGIVEEDGGTLRPVRGGPGLGGRMRHGRDVEVDDCSVRFLFVW